MSPADTVALSLSGLSCAGCVRKVETALAAEPGVDEAAVNFATSTARVSGEDLNAEGLIAAIERAGFRAAVQESTPDRRDREARARAEETRTARRRVLIAAALTAPVFALEMGGHVIPGVHGLIETTIGHRVSWAVQLVLTTLVLAGPGRLFFTAGVPALLRGAPEMNSLVALGAGAAWAYSVVVTLAPGLLPETARAVYFEAGAVIVTLILLGRYLEALAKGRTSAAIRSLLGLQPKTARRVRSDGVEDIPIETVEPGDLIQVRPGERAPVDGVVTKGASYLDESMISGEPAPVLKEPGAEIVGGTVNTTGAFVFRAERTGADTVLAQIIALVEEAQAAKLPIQALVDRVTGVFVPVVMSIAALTFLVWLIWGPEPVLTYALVSAVAVLIIACPCAMGLATPTSIMVGTGRGAELGVLFRKGDALQALSGVRAVALDKTGTLTEGAPALTDLTVSKALGIEGYDAAEVLRLAASVEQNSEHPIARAIVDAALDQGLALSNAQDFASEPGFGVSARVEGRQVEIGADRLMVRRGLNLSAFAETAQALAEAGKTPLYIAIDGQLAAVLAVADPIKPSSSAAIADFHRAGLETVMITGDDQRTARAVAAQLGIKRVIAEVLPGEKADAVKALRGEAGAVTFVGDGVNDAPALAEADVGIALGAGTDVAIETADVVLMSGDVRGVATAHALSRATLTNIRQNLFWAFAYNASLIPVAAGALYPTFGLTLSPMFAAAAMAASSLCVLVNALRLRGFKPAPAR